MQLRTQGLFGAYVLKGDRCEGEVLFEPVALESPDALVQSLKRGGFRARTGLVATRDRTYGANATVHERRRGAMIEQVMLLELPYRLDTVIHKRTIVGAQAAFPARLAPQLSPVIATGTAVLAEFCHEAEQKARRSEF
ncbi:hypothetical protein D3C72_1992560 [compost metagenome]